MTTVRANRPLFYMGSKYKKGDSFKLVENDGVLWGPGVIEVVKIGGGDEPPEIAEPDDEPEAKAPSAVVKKKRGRPLGSKNKNKKKKKAAPPDTMRGLMDKQDREQEDIARRKGIEPGVLQ